MSLSGRKAGRAREAWQTIEATEHRSGNGSPDWPDFEWEDARIDVLEALGRGPSHGFTEPPGVKVISLAAA
jgi:hypothetical protein